MSGLFITGTDTGIGKTWVSCGILVALARLGVPAAAMKPVASGCERTDAGLRNSDALSLQAHMNVAADYQTVNPFAYAPPLSPDIAARRAGRAIELETIIRCHAELAARSECVIVEGVGGWRVPLGRGLELSDVARALGHPLLLVVGVRLGCINHARLTVESLTGSGLAMVGWVANQVDPQFDAFADTVDTLARLLSQPPLATLGWAEDVDSYAESHTEAFSALAKMCCARTK